jgi:hypothetical protein
MPRWTIAAISLAALLSAPSSLLAGDAFLKLGINLNSDLGGFTDRWFASVGSDWGAFGSQGFIGLEFQGSYRSRTDGGFNVKSVPANVFLNLKWKSEQESVRPYAGGGFGLVSTYVDISGPGVSDNEWFKDAGFQMMGGVEFNRKFVVEFMGQTVLESDADWLWSVLGGVRF